MLSKEEFFNKSLTNNLFFLRTIRFFCAHLELTFTPKNQQYIEIDNAFESKCAELESKYSKYANGNIEELALNSQFLVTPYTMTLENETEKLFGIKLDKYLTEEESNLQPGIQNNINDEQIEEINTLNHQTLTMVKNFIDFVKKIYDLEIKNELFSYSYPHLIKFILETAKIDQIALERLIKKQDIDPNYVTDYEYEFVTSLKDCSQYIRSFVNPGASDIFIRAQSFVIEFDNLLTEYKQSSLSPDNQLKLEEEVLALIGRFKPFVEELIQKLLNDKVYFIVEPIFFDSILTRINYFKYILTTNKKLINYVN